MKTNLLLTLLTLLCFSLSGQDGSLDPSFGDDGKVILPYFGETAQILTIIQIEDALFAGGYTKENTEDFSIIKTDLEGNLDNSFGKNGLLRFELGQGFGRCSKLLNHPDGGILAIGWDRNGNKDEYVLIKMDINGTLDTSYGTDGIASGVWNGSSFSEAEIADAMFLSNGNLIAVARSYNGQNTDFIVACYDSSGNPCSGFGTDGIVKELFNGEEDWETGTLITADDNDNIYAGGYYDKNGDDTYAIVKYDSNGNRQASFGSNGVLDITNTSGDDRKLGDLIYDGDGHITVAGSIETSNTFGYVTRFDTNGNLDTSFGIGGETILTGQSSTRLKEIKIADDQSIIVAGNTFGFATKQVIAKLKKSGQIVSSFGNNGIVSLQLASTFSGISEIAVGSDCIYAGGYSYESDVFDWALTKFTNLPVASSVMEYSSATINIYPNPVTSILNIETEEGIQSAIIYDSDGKVIFDTTWSELVTTHQINLVGWKKGFYYLLLENESKTWSYSFVKE